LGCSCLNDSGGHWQGQGNLALKRTGSGFLGLSGGKSPSGGMSRALKFLMFINFVVFLTTGSFMVLIVNADEGSAPWISLLARNHGIVFVWHLACWMNLAMFSNYYWVANAGKGGKGKESNEF
jgi:hypothetical protein